jgi:hypothetical protein
MQSGTRSFHIAHESNDPASGPLMVGPIEKLSQASPPRADWVKAVKPITVWMSPDNMLFRLFSHFRSSLIHCSFCQIFFYDYIYMN